MNGTSNNNTSLSVSSSVSSLPPSSHQNNSATTTIAPCSSSTSSSSSSSSQGSTHISSALNANPLNANLSSSSSALNGSASLGVSQPPTMPFDYQQQFYAPFQGSQFVGGQQSLYSPQNQLDSLVYDKLRMLSNQTQTGAAPGTNFYAHNTNGNGFKLLSTQKQSTSPSLAESSVPPSSTSPRSSLWSQKLPCNNWYQNPSNGGGSASPSGFSFQQNLGLTAITSGGGSGLPNGSSPSPGSAFNASGFNYQRMGFSATDHALQQQDTPPPHDTVKIKG